MKIQLNIKDIKDNEYEFEFENNYSWGILTFSNWEFIEYRSFDSDKHLSFEITLDEQEYTPKNIRELIKVRNEYYKKVKKIRQKLLNDTNIPWVDFE